MEPLSGVYCSTSGTFFTDKEELAEHYKSDYHRYNLKRKIAGLPPVTRDWFDSRKEQLSGTPVVSSQKTWLDPLTKKRFLSENTYLAHTNSKKYLDLVQRSGQPAPPPLVTTKHAEGKQLSAATSGSAGTYHHRAIKRSPSTATAADYIEVDVEDSSDWETASEEGDLDTRNVEIGPCTPAAKEEDVQQWDVRRSLFDNHLSPSMEANLEYMWKHFGFYFPDAEYLTDPEGLLQYLGAKLGEGHIPLYASGIDANAKQFASLHAAQRHMVDTNQCKMAFDGIEEEYDDFYDYSKLLESISGGPDSREVVMAGSEDALAYATGGFELALPGQEGRKQRMLGSREFMRYYRQRHRRPDVRTSVAINTVLQQYRRLAVPLLEGPADVAARRAEKQAQKLQKKEDRIQLRTVLRDNVNRNLPRNVTF